MLPELTDAEALRYNRQIVLRGFDFDGQEKLKAARVLIAGLGGLGCAAAPYLAAAGVGHLVLVDFDTVSLSNLQRQILHRDDRIGQSKVASAKRELSAINPHIRIDAIDGRLEDDAVAAEIAACDLVLDCTDNVAARDALNRLCHAQQRPLVSGAAIRMEGQRRQRPHLRRSGRDGAAGRHYRHPAGDGGHQAAGRLWSAAARQAVDVRCDEHAVPRDETAEGSALRGVRRGMTDKKRAG